MSDTFFYPALAAPIAPPVTPPVARPGSTKALTRQRAGVRRCRATGAQTVRLARA